MSFMSCFTLYVQLMGYLSMLNELDVLHVMFYSLCSIDGIS